jgi:ABC-type nitrate/sulfonate/bicarbonate transport system permease component
MFLAGVVIGIPLGLLLGTWAFFLRQSAKRGLDALDKTVAT